MSIGQIRDEIKKAKQESKQYILRSIEPFNNDEGHRYIFNELYSGSPFIVNSYSAFGEWVVGHNMKLGDTIKIKLNLGDQVDFAELPEKKIELVKLIGSDHK